MSYLPAPDPRSLAPRKEPEDAKDEGERKEQGELRRDANGVAHDEVEERKAEANEGGHAQDRVGGAATPAGSRRRRRRGFVRHKESIEPEKKEGKKLCYNRRWMMDDERIEPQSRKEHKEITKVPWDWITKIRKWRRTRRIGC
jgi:hypothetical protein